MKNLLKSNEFYLALLIAVIATGITVMNPSFLTGQNIYGFLKTASVDGIMAVGVLFVLILGGTPDVFVHRDRAGGAICDRAGFCFGTAATFMSRWRSQLSWVRPWARSTE